MVGNDLRGAGRAVPAADPRPVARAGAVGRRPRDPVAAEPAGRVQAPAGAARGGPGRRPRRRPAPLVPASARAAGRGRRLARALPAILVGPPRRPRSPPRRKGLNMDGTLLRYGDDCVVRFERHLAHPVEKVWRAITEQDELRQWFPDGGLEIDLTLGGKVRFAAEGW